MARLKLHNKSYVLVCDGSKALFYTNVGDAQVISLQVIKTMEDRHPPTRELGTDKPGRSIYSMGDSRSSMQETDWHDAAEAQFLRQVAKTFSEVVRASQTRQAVVVAPPRALGILREHLADDVRSVMKAEFTRDLVRLPTPKVEAFLQAEGELH